MNLVSDLRSPLSAPLLRAARALGAYLAVVASVPLASPAARGADGLLSAMEGEAPDTVRRRVYLLQGDVEILAPFGSCGVDHTPDGMGWEDTDVCHARSTTTEDA